MQKALGDSAVVPGAMPDFEPAAAAASRLPETVAEMHDKVFQAGKLGFVQGVQVSRTNRPNSHAHVSEDLTKYAIDNVDLDKEKSTLVEMGIKTNKQRIEVAAGDLITGWRICHNKVTAVVPRCWTTDACPLKSLAWGVALAKGAVMCAMKVHYEQSLCHNPNIELYTLPNQARTKVAIKPKGELVLVAASQRIDQKASAGSVGLGEYEIVQGLQPVKLFLAPQTVLPLDADGKIKPNAWVAPFWFVESTTQEEEVNMELQFVTEFIGGFSVKVPVLNNIKKLKEMDVLKQIQVDTVQQPNEQTPAKKPRR